MTTNSALAWENLSDAGIVSAAGAIPLAPASNLQNVHVGKKWRHNAASSFVLVDLGALKPVDTVMLAGLSGENPTLRVRYSTVDATGAAGDAFDTGSFTGLPRFSPDYAMLVDARPAPINARYVRIDIAEAAVPFIEAGRLAVSSREVFSTNMQAPWTRQAIRGAIDTVGVGGQTYTDFRPGHWRVQASYQFLTELERNDFVDAIGIALVNLGRLDMLWIRDADSANLARDSIWGYLESDFTVTQNLYIIPALFAVEFPIRQRL